MNISEKAKGIIEKELKPSITDAEIQAYLQLYHIPFF